MVSGEPLPGHSGGAYAGPQAPVREERRMDTLLQVVISISMYVLIFVVIGLVFYAVDKRVKGFLRRPAHCRSCSSEIAPGTSAVRGLCASCASKRRPAHR